ncbi:malate:quinone oxidoreductase [Klebsiella michiganensis]|nr:malate:quinone oxidoreductase [Klebsiella michiganensis]
MKFSTDHAQIKQWAPLVMEGRDPQQRVAATWTPVGTDVNYGEITRQLIGSLKKIITSRCRPLQKSPILNAMPIIPGT